jgi:hypothetical protein
MPLSDSAARKHLYADSTTRSTGQLLHPFVHIIRYFLGILLRLAGGLGLPELVDLLAVADAPSEEVVDPP